ncbi:MAG: TIGR01458 family HAD-type hydrolase [Flavobacteriaceae bacterium]
MIIKAFLFDLDGVFYVDDYLIEGGNETLSFLRKKEIPFRFITNNTTKSRKKLAHKLLNLGLEVKEEEIVSANYAGVLLLDQLGLTNCKLILEAEAQEDYSRFKEQKQPPEAIVIGDIGQRWDYTLMNALLQDLLKGTKLIALHKGRYFKSEGGLTLDAGAFVAGLEYASGKKATVVGKPNAPFFELASAAFTCAPNEIVLVGDDFVNDIEGGKKMGYSTIMVQTGKFRPELAKQADVQPDFYLPSIADLPQWIEQQNKNNGKN